MQYMDEKYTDLCISGSDFSEKKYHSAFHYYGEILKIGTPRNDKLAIPNPAEERKTREKLGIEDDTKILIYAPTFRDSQKGVQDVMVDLIQAINILEEKGDKWVCLIRAHVVSAGLNFVCDGQKFINVSQYPDLYDLLAITNILITDYSSCSGDPIRFNKEVILLLFDKDDYIANNREFYYDPADAGFIVAYNQEELNEILHSKTRNDVVKNCEHLREYFGIIESGHASEEISRRIDQFYKSNYQH